MITVYTQPTCGQCKMVKLLLQQKNIKYVACEDLEKMKSVGIAHTPTLQTPEGKLLTGKEMIEWIRSFNS